MKDHLLQLLISIGFSAKEARVYLSLLATETATANEIAKGADINRTTVYDVLEVLIKRGVVSKFKKKNRNYFRVSDPEKLVTYLEHEKNETNKIIEKKQDLVRERLSELLSIQFSLSTKPKVYFYEGEKGMREAYEDTLSSKDNILAYANVQTVHEALPNFFPDYYKRRANKKIPIYAVFTDNKLSRERSKFDKEELRQTKFLSDPAMTFSPEINIYNNKMLVASWKEKIAIIIESKELADVQRIIYKIVWDSLEKDINNHRTQKTR